MAIVRLYSEREEQKRKRNISNETLIYDSY